MVPVGNLSTVKLRLVPVLVATRNGQTAVDAGKAGAPTLQDGTPASIALARPDGLGAPGRSRERLSLPV
jgi:hypothetical protein